MRAEQPGLEPGQLTPEEIKVADALEKQKHTAAMARLPKFTSERLAELLKILCDVHYPISFEALRQILGRPDSLVWCCTMIKGRKQRSTYSVAALDPNFGAYEFVMNFEDSPTHEPSTRVAQARLCYLSPFGWSFTAESIADYYKSVRRIKDSPGHFHRTMMVKIALAMFERAKDDS